MKKSFFKKLNKRVILFSFILLTAFLLASLAYAATTITNNQVVARRVTNSSADFTVLDFAINVDGDTTLAGTEPAGGTAISADKPGDWTQMKFYDSSAGGAWNSGSDWVGSSHSNYYQLAATILACPDGNLPPVYYRTEAVCSSGSPYPTPNGEAGWGNGNLKYIEDSSYICTNSFTNPTFIYRATSNDCGTLACDGDHRQDCYVLGNDGSAWNVGPSGHVSNAIAQTYGWVWHDGSGGGAYTPLTENLFIIPSAYRSIDTPMLFYNNSVTISGTTPPSVTSSAPTSLSASKPADWTTMKFYDHSSSGAQFNSGTDWLGLDNDATGFFADRLNAITFNLHSDANTISPANVSNVKLWAGNPGSGTLLGTASSFDGGGSGWYLSNLNRSLSAGSNRFYATITLNGTATDGKTVRVHIPRFDSNNNKSFDLDDGDSGVFLTTRHLGDILNAASITVDTIPPTLTITMTDNELKNGDTTTVNFVFSEEVSGFTSGDITVGNGSLSNFTTSNNITWTATYTPTDNLDYVGTNIISVNMPGLTDLAGNLGVGTVNSANYQVDTRRPTLTSAVFSDAKVQIGDTPTVTFTFSEPVAGFTLENAISSVAHGELSDLNAVSESVYTATFTPTEEVDYVGTNIIVVDMSVIEDTRLNTKSNFGTGTANSCNYELDTRRPTLLSAIFANDEMLVGENSVVTFEFSEKVKDFTTTDLASPFGGLAGLSSADDGITWTATFTPNTDTEGFDNVLTILMSGIKDKRLDPAGSKGNVGGDNDESEVYQIDTLRPTLVISMDDEALIIGETAIVTFTFSEEIKDFSLHSDTITILDNSSWDNDYGLQTEEGINENIVYTAKLIPDNNVDYVTDNIIRVDLTKISDVNLKAGNTGWGNTDSSEFEIDTTRPTLIITMDDDALIIGETAIVTFTFSEEVDGFSLDDISLDDATVANGELSDLEQDDIDPKVWTATLTPKNNIDFNTQNWVTVNKAGVVDINISPGNTGDGKTNSLNYLVDTTRPSLEITMSRYVINRDQTAIVSFTFSEEVTDFDLVDVGVENGSLSDLATSDDIVYTATFTPDMDIEDNTNVLSFDLSNVADINISPYNIGEGLADSLNYVVDTVNPSFNIQYYRDRELQTEINGDSYLKAGTYYIKISASETLSLAPTISIEAEGIANDVLNGSTVHISGNTYRYTRVISNDNAAIGDVLEEITISASDAAGNTVSNISPSNEGDKAIYTDTVAPLVNAGADKGQVSSTFTQTGAATDIDGSGIASYLWSKQSGYYDVTFGSPNLAETTVNVRGGGPYVIKLTVTDNAGNTASDTFSFTWGSIPSSGFSSPPSVGSGAVDRSVSINQTEELGNLDIQGKNVLSYINSDIRFSAKVSQTGFFKNYTLKVKDLNTLNKEIKLELNPLGQMLTLKPGDKLHLDLDGDNINDIFLVYNELLVNRIDITISQLNFSLSKLEKEESPSNEGTTKPETVDVGNNDGEKLQKEVLKREKERQGSINNALSTRLAGRILLQAEENGEAWYLEPDKNERHYLGRPADAFAIMRKFGLGISEANFAKFQTEGVPSRFSGRILLRVEANGEAYYISPVDLKMHYLGRPADAFRIMRELALGVSNDNLNQIPLGLDEFLAVCLIDIDLSLGMERSEVFDLQRYLNTTNSPIALNGTGSKGLETNGFGSLTVEALKKFQVSNNLKQTGVFDQDTRDFLSCY